MSKPRTRLVSRIGSLIRRNLLKKPELWGVDAEFWAHLYTWSRTEPLTDEEEALLVALVDRYMIEVNLPRSPWAHCPELDVE